ncbi:MAG: hypothetical protein RLZZ440_2603 [Planctomycetota bacterium]
MTLIHPGLAADRRGGIAPLAAACLTAAWALATSLVAASLAAAQEPETTWVEVELRVDGELFAEADPARPPVTWPIRLDAGFVFREQQRPMEEDAPIARRYLTARADVTSDGQPSHTALAADARDVLLTLRGTTPSPYLADGFLSREEAELLDLPFESMLIDGLRPTEGVAPETTWRVPADLTAGLLSIDTVESGGIDARLVEVTDGVARVSLEGTVTGAVAGAATRIELSGRFQCPASAASEPGLWRLDGRVQQLAVEIAERREAGWVAPGLTVTAALTLTRSSSAPAASDSLGSETPAGLAPAAAARPRGPGRPGIVWERHRLGRFTLVIDDRWSVVEDGSEGLVMRLMDRGALVAQCSILPLPRINPESAPDEATVRRDVERSLGDQFGLITAGETATRADGTTIVRVVAEGTAEDRPFRWIHQVLTDPAGHRAAVTCMHEPAVAERFGIADRELVAGLVLTADRSSDPLRQARNPPSSAGAESAEENQAGSPSTP